MGGREKFPEWICHLIRFQLLAEIHVMRMGKALFLMLTLLPFGSQGFGDSLRNEEIPNLINQNCENANEVSIRVVNMNGTCQAFWKCDDTALEVKCEYGQCECRHDSTNVVTKISYEECDSDKLKTCFNMAR